MSIVRPPGPVRPSLGYWFSLLSGQKPRDGFPLLSAQLCPTLCDPMEYSPPGSSVCGIFQARILGWVAIPFSRGSF